MGLNKGRIIMYVGLPASGKSTAARDALANGNVMRVNRDDLRSMLFARWKGKKEQIVTDTEVAAITAAVKGGYDIIIDDTNLNPGTQQKWANLATSLGTTLIRQDFDTSIAECVDRDYMRSGRARVGRSVIENMALRYNLMPILSPDTKIVIWDVDGTMADCLHRKTYLNVCRNCNETEEFHEGNAVNECEAFVPGKKNHKVFYSKVSADYPIQIVIDWNRACHEAGYYNIVVSGRPTDLAGNATEAWLNLYGAKYKHMFMRAAGDFTNDTRVKQEILDRILQWVPKEQILFAVDDRPRVIRMWKDNGIKCYDVGEGIEF